MWLKELRTHSNPDTKVFLIGNKIDLENERVINREQAEEYSNQNHFNLFMESSAKTGFNAQKIFIEAAKILYEDYLKYQHDDVSRGSIGNFKPINSNDNQNQLNMENKNSGGCC